MEDLGTLQAHGDRWTITFTRRFAHPIEKVWQAVTEPEHLAAWFPQEIRGDRRPGAPLQFVSSGGDSFEGRMLAFEPPTVMELMWGVDRLRIELRAEGDSTVLTLVDEFAELGKAARDAAGWHECLDRLHDALEGVESTPWGHTWQELNQRYVERMGPRAATIGPPPGSG